MLLRPIRFRLRTLFLLMLSAGVVCSVLRYCRILPEIMAVNVALWIGMAFFIAAETRR